MQEAAEIYKYTQKPPLRINGIANLQLCDDTAADMSFALRSIDAWGLPEMNSEHLNSLNILMTRCIGLANILSHSN